jgi:hypothetical protein
VNPGVHNHNSAVHLFVLFSQYTLIISLDTRGKNNFLGLMSSLVWYLDHLFDSSVHLDITGKSGDGMHPPVSLEDHLTGVAFDVAKL